MNQSNNDRFFNVLTTTPQLQLFSIPRPTKSFNKDHGQCTGQDSITKTIVNYIVTNQHFQTN